MIAADTAPGATPPLAVLLLRLPLQDMPTAQIVAALARHPLLQNTDVAPLPGAAMPGSVVLGLGPRRVTLLSLDGGAPAAVLEQALVGADPAVAAASRYHRGHLLIAPYPGERELAVRDPFAAGRAAPALGLTLAAAALAEAVPALALALLWQPSQQLIALPRLRERVDALDLAALPLDLWLRIEAEPAGSDGQRLFTRGLRALGCPAELDLLAPASDTGARALLAQAAAALVADGLPAGELLVLPGGRSLSAVPQPDGHLRIVPR